MKQLFRQSALKEKWDKKQCFIHKRVISFESICAALLSWKSFKYSEIFRLLFTHM